MVTRWSGPRAPATGTAHARARRDIDAIVIWRLDWGRSLADLVGTLQELHALGVGFISLSETLDFTTPTGRAMAGLLAIFAEFEREILRGASKPASHKPVDTANAMADHHATPGMCSDSMRRSR